VVFGPAKPALNQDRTIEPAATRAESYLAHNLSPHKFYRNQPMQNNRLVVVARLSVANVVVVALEAVNVCADVVLVDSDDPDILHRLAVGIGCVAAHTQTRAQDRQMIREVDEVLEREDKIVPPGTPSVDAEVQQSLVVVCLEVLAYLRDL